jgi:hypothetical protein
MIEDLRRLWKHHGRLSQRIIAQDPDARSPATYQARFGTLMRAYELAGCRPSDRQRVASERIRHTQPHRYRPPPESYSDDELLRRLSDLLEAFGYLNADLISEQPGPSRELYAKRFGGMRRVYALVGYVPNAYQENTMDRQGGQTIDREEARRIREGLSVR